MRSKETREPQRTASTTIHFQQYNNDRYLHLNPIFLKWQIIVRREINRCDRVEIPIRMYRQLP